MESNCTPKGHKSSAAPKKHRGQSKQKAATGSNEESWQMLYPADGIRMEDCDEGSVGVEEIHDEGGSEEWAQIATDASNNNCTVSDVDSHPVSDRTSRPVDKSGCSDSSTGASGQLQIDIERFIEQKRKIINQIKVQDPKLFAEYCNTTPKEQPWYCAPKTQSKQQSRVNSPSTSKMPACPIEIIVTPPTPGKANISNRAPPVQDANLLCVPKRKPQKQKCPSAKVAQSQNQSQSPCGTSRSASPKATTSRQVATDPCAYAPKLHQEPAKLSCPTPKNNRPATNQAPVVAVKTPCQSTTSFQAPSNTNHNRKIHTPKVCAPKITGDQKKDIEAKQKFAKIKKIELDTVLDRNVHDLSLDIPDRDPKLIASLMNSNFRLDDDPTEVYNAMIHPVGRHRLSATDVHHTDPGSMVPKEIPVTHLNQLSSEILDELEAIFRSQGIPYPQDDVATNETRNLDVRKKEPEKPKPKPIPPASLFSCALELQPLRVENFFQLRGSNSPNWYPGMMASFPDGSSALRLIRSPSGLIKTAYTFCKP